MEHLQPGTSLQNGRYLIQKLLGHGGFGITYTAQDTHKDRTVAIKELFLQGVNERTEGDSSTVVVSNQSNTLVFEQQKNKFEKEARRLAELNNEHIVKVHEYFEENDTAYYVMDYVEGQSLQAVSKAQQVTEQQAEDYLEQILEAMKAIHERHIWHLDIKPANILIDGNGQLVLIDFGASKHIEQGGHLTTSSAMAYTPGFAPPEQMQGSMEKFGPWTDFYALGATIYQVMTRHTPPSFADILSEGESAFDFTPAMSREMQQKIMWMMNPNRKERPQSVEDFYNKSGATVVGSPETVVGSKETIVGSQETLVSGNQGGHQTVVQKPEEENNSSWNWVLGLLGIVAVIVVVVVIIVVNNMNQPKQAAPYDDYYAYEVTEAPMGVEEVTEEAAPVEVLEDKTPDLHRWDGTYVAEYCAGDTYGGTAMCYGTVIELGSINDSEYYEGTIRVDGWQVGWTANIEATAFEDNTLKIWISDNPQGLGALNVGDAVARFIYNGGNNYAASWFGPMLEYQYVDQSTDISYTPN